jgi:hypothetical protein
MKQLERAPEPAEPQPTVLRSESTGLEIRWEPCAKCGAEVKVVKSPRLYGSTRDECVCEKRQREAKAIVNARRAEIKAKVAQRVTETENDRYKRAEAQLEPLVAQERMRVLAELRWRDTQSYMVEAEESMLAEVVAELKAKEN